MAEWFESQAAAGSLAVAVPVALIAGLVSFFSPCVIPLLPGYLSYATGLSGADIATGGATRDHRGRMLLGSLLFVSGFAVVFVLAFTAFGGVAAELQQSRRAMTLLLGSLLIVLGLVFSGAIPWLQREWRVHKLPGVGLAAAPFIGALFAVGWTPCVGPTLAVIATLTYADGGTATRGALLGLTYAIGLGLPFVLAAVFYERMLGTIGWVRRHQIWVMRIGGLLMIALGLAMITGWWEHLVQWVQLQVVDFGATAV